VRRSANRSRTPVPPRCFKAAPEQEIVLRRLVHGGAAEGCRRDPSNTVDFSSQYGASTWRTGRRYRDRASLWLPPSINSCEVNGSAPQRTPGSRRPRNERDTGTGSQSFCPEEPASPVGCGYARSDRDHQPQFREQASCLGNPRWEMWTMRSTFSRGEHSSHDRGSSSRPSVKYPFAVGRRHGLVHMLQACNDADPQTRRYLSRCGGITALPPPCRKH